MKRVAEEILLGLAVALAPLLLTAGCPLDAGSTVRDIGPGARLYWVELRDGKLAAFALPERRGEPGQWVTLETAGAAWYAGPGLYELSAAGEWSPVTTDESLTLDEIIMVHDPPPSPRQ